METIAMGLLWEMGHPEQMLWGTIRESDRYTESEGQTGSDRYRAGERRPSGNPGGSDRKG